MTRALELGILSFHVESVAELELLDAVAGKLGKKAPVALRLNPDVDAKTHPYISTGLKRDKFGIPVKEALEIARLWGRYRNIDIDGVSIHIGSQLLTLKPLEEAFLKTREAIRLLDRLLPRPVRFADLGGGVGIGYRSGQSGPEIEKYCRLIMKYFGPRADLDHPLRLAVEPGRLLSGNAGVLLSRVLFRKSRGSKDFLVLDAAMNDLIRPALYQSHHEVVPVEQRLGRGTLKKTDVVGPVCESGDCLASARALSPRLKSGDLVALLSAGAYGFSMSSNYNSRPRPPEYLIRDGKALRIRRRETIEDLIGPEL